MEVGGEEVCVCRQVSPFPPTSVSARGTKFNERLLFFFFLKYVGMLYHFRAYRYVCREK